MRWGKMLTGFYTNKTLRSVDNDVGPVFQFQAEILHKTVSCRQSINLHPNRSTSDCNKNANNAKRG